MAKPQLPIGKLAHNKPDGCPCGQNRKTLWIYQTQVIHHEPSISKIHGFIDQTLLTSLFFWTLLPTLPARLAGLTRFDTLPAIHLSLKRICCDSISNSSSQIHCTDGTWFGKWSYFLAWSLEIPFWLIISKKSMFWLVPMCYNLVFPNKTCSKLVCESSGTRGDYVQA